MVVHIFLRIHFVRWQGVNGEHSTGFRYLYHVEQQSPVLTGFRSLSLPNFKRSEWDEAFVIFPPFFVAETDGIS
jgi:hypothetical protein